jgi:hypothetical protein
VSPIELERLRFFQIDALLLGLAGRANPFQHLISDALQQHRKGSIRRLLGQFGATDGARQQQLAGDLAVCVWLHHLLQQEVDAQGICLSDDEAVIWAQAIFLLQEPIDDIRNGYQDASTLTDLAALEVAVSHMTEGALADQGLRSDDLSDRMIMGFARNAIDGLVAPILQQARLNTVLGDGGPLPVAALVSMMRREADDPGPTPEAEDEETLTLTRVTDDDGDPLMDRRSQQQVSQAVAATEEVLRVVAAMLEEVAVDPAVTRGAAVVGQRYASLPSSDERFFLVASQAESLCWALCRLLSGWGVGDTTTARVVDLAGIALGAAGAPEAVMGPIVAAAPEVCAAFRRWHVPSVTTGVPFSERNSAQAV